MLIYTPIYTRISLAIANILKKNIKLNEVMLCLVIVMMQMIYLTMMSGN
jgi:hypothetical protein